MANKVKVKWTEHRYQDPGCIVRHAVLHRHNAAIFVDGALREEFYAVVVEEIIPNVFTAVSEEGGGELCLGYKAFVSLAGSSEEQEIPLFVGVILPLVKAIVELVLQARIGAVLGSEGADDYEVEVDDIVGSVEKFLEDERGKGDEDGTTRQV